MVYLIVFITGICIGSFLNVLIYRMPREEKIGLTRSFCPQCRQMIAWYDNIPLFSYLFLKGKCRHCAARISLRYFIVELLTGLLFCSLWWRFGVFSVAFVVVYAVFVCLLIVGSFIDLEFYIIPDAINLSGIVFTLIVAPLYPSLHNTGLWWLGLYRCFLGIIVAGGVLYLIAVSASAILKKEAMGMGDVKLLAMIGGFLGWPWALLTIFVASLLGTIAGLVLIMLNRVSIKGKIPFGPFLALGGLINLFWGPNIVHWYINLFS